MTTLQSNFNGYLAYKAQSGLGVPASGSGGTVLRQTGGTPGKLAITAVQSKEVRRDAMVTRGRHGMQATSGGPFDTEYSVGSLDAILTSIMRGTFDTEITVDASDFTSITTGANTIIWAGGNPIAKGIRVGDIYRILGSVTTANNDRNLRVVELSTTTITVAESLTIDATPDSTPTMKRVGRKVINPAAGSLARTYFTIEEYDADIDESVSYSDCLWSAIKFAMAPNGLLMASPSFVGTGAFEQNGSGPAPILTAPTTPAGSPLAVLDATVRLGTGDVLDLTSFDLTLDIGAVAPAVAAARVSPDVLPGQFTAVMNLKMLRADLTNVAAYLAETSLSLHVLAVENTAEPKNFLSINVPFFTLGGVDPSALSTAGGGREETISIPAALIGADTSGSGYDSTMVSMQVSNNS